MLIRNKTIAAGSIICFLVLIFSQCVYTSSTHGPRGDAYAGSAACVKCHAGIAASYVHTAHSRSVSAATKATIQGNFAPGANTFTINAANKIMMEKRDSGLYQVYYKDGKEIEAHRFDIVFGSVKGETYLWWKENQLFQLPVSYSNELHQWTNSPGYDSGREAEFDRQIEPRCFECHSSYIQLLQTASESSNMAKELDKSSVVYNIDCERCHGAAAAHVQYQTENPDSKTAKYIVSYKSLTRQQKIDMCAQCHSGNNNIRIRSLFAFQPGDTLLRYILPGYSNGNNKLDVHGNQTQLLSQSQCFLHTNLTCTTCHDVHVNQRGNKALFNERCQSCHTSLQHTSLAKINTQTVQFINTNCITCHMPLQSSNKIILRTTGNKQSANIKVITHYIAVYPDVAKEVMKNNLP